jgi:hypothetical protein
MSETKKGQASNKDTRKTIEQQFETLLTNWKEQLGEKKFKNRVKKAAKAFSKGLPLVKKETPVNKKTAKNAAGGKKAIAGKKMKKAITGKKVKVVADKKEAPKPAPEK